DFLTAVRGQLLPEVVDFRLRLTFHDQGHRLGELELRPTVEPEEFLPVELERHRHHRAPGLAGGSGRLLVVAGDRSDLRVLEDRRVEPGGLFGLAVEPQAHADLLSRLCHWRLLLPRVWLHQSVERRKSGSTVANRGPPTQMADATFFAAISS